MTSNGVASKELLPNNYKFRMMHAFASNDKDHDISSNPTVIFQTVNTQVELRDGNSDLIDEGTVKYYSGGWRDFGVTSSGVALKELLPNSYQFRMSYEYGSNDKTQSIETNPLVQFSTVSAIIKVSNTQGQPVNGAQAKYYSSGWRSIGETINGEVVKKLLPNNFQFRINYEAVQEDKTQDLTTDNIVEFVIDTGE